MEQPNNTSVTAVFFRFSEQISVHFAIKHEGAATIFEGGMLSTYVNTKFSPLLKKFLGSKMFIKNITLLTKKYHREKINIVYSLGVIHGTYHVLCLKE